MPRRSKATENATRELGWAQEWQIGLRDEAFLNIPFGQTLLVEMGKMFRTDETVGSMMWCISSTLAQVTWAHVPQVDGKDNDTDPEAVRAADFANTMLLDMEHSFGDHVDDALTMIPYGFALSEIVLKQRDGVNSQFDDKFWGISKLAHRDARTITGWQYERGRAIACDQATVDGSATIPLWKLVHYKTSHAQGRPQGWPLLLNAYRAWRLKMKIQDSEAIGIERDLCGLPVLKVPEEAIEQAAEQANGVYTPAAVKAQAKLAAYTKVVSDMRFNKSGGLILPSDTFSDETPTDKTAKFDFKIVTTAGQRSIDTRTAARDYDRAIARVAMMQFLHLGDRSTGSYSLSDDQSSMAIRSLMAMAMRIAVEYTRKVLPMVWEVNGWDKRYLPRLRASEISKDGVVQIGSFLAGLGKAAGLWETDTEARISLLKMANIGFDRGAQSEAAGAALEKAQAEALAPPTPTFQAKPGADPSDDTED